MLRKFLQAASFLSLISAGRADVIYNLDQGGGCCGTGLFGIVTLHVLDADTVLVTETLTAGEVYAVTGAGDSLEFNLDKSFTIVNGTLTTGFTAGSSGKASPFGDFGSFVDCTDGNVCGNGTSPPRFSGPLSFQVYNVAGLSPSDFIANKGGFFFSSDIGVPKTGGGFTTGNVAANSSFSQSPPPSTPEPSSMLLMGIGSAVFVLRKRLTRSC